MVWLHDDDDDDGDDDDDDGDDDDDHHHHAHAHTHTYTQMRGMPKATLCHAESSSTLCDQEINPSDQEHRLEKKTRKTRTHVMVSLAKPHKCAG